MTSMPSSGDLAPTSRAATRHEGYLAKIERENREKAMKHDRNEEFRAPAIYVERKWPFLRGTRMSCHVSKGSAKAEEDAGYPAGLEEGTLGCRQGGGCCRGE